MNLSISPLHPLLDEDTERRAPEDLRVQIEARASEDPRTQIETRDSEDPRTQTEARASEDLRTQIETHDRYGFDLKIGSRLRSKGDGARVSYSVDTFLFFPFNFRMGSANYPATRLFSDLKAYLRRDPPSLWRGDALDETPLRVLEASLESPSEEDSHYLSSSARRVLLYGCSLRRTVRKLFDGVEPLDSERVQRRLQALSEHLESFRGFRARLSDDPEAARADYSTAALIADEASSYLLEEMLGGFSAALPSRRANAEAAEISERVCGVAAREMAYRRQQGFCVLDEDEIEGEYFIYRVGQLKKAMDGVLYFDMRTLKQTSKVKHFIGGVGAAFAATFAFLAHTGPGGVWRASGLSTLLLFAAAVVAYTLKDRIKDITKERLNRWWRLKTPDRLSEFEATTSDRQPVHLVGNLHERTRYLRRRDLDDMIIKVRGCGHVVDVLRDRRETILSYQKTVDYELSAQEGDRVCLVEAVALGVKDLLRLNVRGFLEHLDDPTRTIRYFDSSRGAFACREASKVYHLNIVLRYCLSSDDGEASTTYERLRVILNRDGIARIETVLERGTHEWLSGA